MRIKKMIILWATFVAGVIVIYIGTDTKQKVSDRPWGPEDDDSNNISLKSSLNYIVRDDYQYNLRVAEEIYTELLKLKDTETNVIWDEPPEVVKFNFSSCPIQNDVIPKVDVQTLSLLEKANFNTVYNSIWKHGSHGWDIRFYSSHYEKRWTQKNKLKVFLVPHSHNDPGDKFTFEEYYEESAKSTLRILVKKLTEDASRKFIWAETNFLFKWWTTDATDYEKVALKKLLRSGQLEIVTGGWVMNDEANSHWVGVAQQLTAGHQWLVKALRYSPRSAWAIDPFGHSAAQPFLLRLAGLRRSVVQRVHYRLKKELASARQLEFNWRQLWDSCGVTDIFIHVVPFTCGPDPTVCCQFEFMRLYGDLCRWGPQPKQITRRNIEDRAFLILDQWRKKSEIFRSNVILVPIGGDFSFNEEEMWDYQFNNYAKLIEYFNKTKHWNTQVQFGTLSDYFRELHSEVKPAQFPVLSGDLFTYADRGQHYWSGYYSLRPFYKSMDRALLAYLRAAEIITAQATSSKALKHTMSMDLCDTIEQVRRALALFQHHEAITGTASTRIMQDYGKKMLAAINACQMVIKKAAYYLLKIPVIAMKGTKEFFFEMEETWRHHNELPVHRTIILDAVWPVRRLVLYNALAFRRTEILTVIVSSPHVEVTDAAGKPVRAQVAPVVAGGHRLGFAVGKFQLSFPVTVEPLALAVYDVSLRDSDAIMFTSYARVRVYNADYWNIDLPKMFVVKQPVERLAEDVTLQAGNSTRLVATRLGLLKAVVSGGAATPVHMDYVQYDSKQAPDNNSGAYLFNPGGPAQPLRVDAFPELVLTEGPYRASLHAALVAPKQAEIGLTMSVDSNPSRSHAELEITNTFLIDPQADDLELAMRFSTGIANGDVFFTDVNGMQMIKRRYLKKLPLQANFYPLPAAAYIEDGATRLTLLTSAPLGVAALQPGQIEVMQDRRLSRDDNRGLNQGVFDNVRTRHTFRLLLEGARVSCEHKVPLEHPSGQLSLGAHVAQQTLLQPLVAMHYAGRAADSPPTYERATANAADIVLASFNPRVSAMDRGKLLNGMGITFQRIHLDTCYGSGETNKWYFVGNGEVNLARLFDVQTASVFESTLTFTRLGEPIQNATFSLCPMEIRAVFINQTL